MSEPGPWIVSAPADSESSSVLDSAIICGVANRLGSKLITLPAWFALALAWEMAQSRSPEGFNVMASVPELAPVSLVRFTV